MKSKTTQVGDSKDGHDLRIFHQIPKITINAIVLQPMIDENSWGTSGHGSVISLWHQCPQHKRAGSYGSTFSEGLFCGVTCTSYHYE